MENTLGDNVTEKNSFEILGIQDGLIKRINWDKFLQAFNLHKNIYNDFFGLKESTYDSKICLTIPKALKRQKAYYNKIEELMKSQNDLIFIAKNFKIIFKNKYQKKDVEEMYRLKDSCSIGINKIEKRETSLSREAKRFFQATHFKGKQSRQSNEIFQGPALPAFGCGILPCFQFDQEKNSISQRNDFPYIGLIFAYAPDLRKSSDNNCLNEDYEYFKEGEGLNWKKLKDYMIDVTDTLFYSAMTMTQQRTLGICYMRVPMIGIGVFCPSRHKKQVARIYFEAYKKSLEKFSSEYSDMVFYLDFFDFREDVRDMYQAVFVEEKKYHTKYYYKESVFNLNIINPELKERLNEVFCIQCMASDGRSFWNQNGIPDVSLERVMMGYDNDHALIPGCIANYFGDLYFYDENNKNLYIDHPLLQGDEELERKELEQEKLREKELEQKELERKELEREKLEQEKLEQEKLEQEKLEQEKLEQKEKRIKKLLLTGGVGLLCIIMLIIYRREVKQMFIDFLEISLYSKTNSLLK
jgi:hypothetical protein